MPLILTDEPRFNDESLRLLDRFEAALRERVYNLVEDHVRRSREPVVGPEVVESCILQALAEFSATSQGVAPSSND
jgi:hypothetical protein